MSTQSQWWSNINHVSDEILERITKYGMLEDIVFKERISFRFGTTTNRILSNLKTFKTKSSDLTNCKGKVNSQRALNLMKRMPKVNDGTLIHHWPPKLLKQLANINQSMVRCYRDWDNNISRASPFEVTSKKYLSYIRAIKVISTEYDGSDIDFVFEDGEEELERCTDLKLKLNGHIDSLSHEKYADLYHTITLLGDHMDIDHGKRYPNVKMLDIYDDHDPSIMKLFPNIQHLRLFFDGCGNNIRDISSMLVSKLSTLSIGDDEFSDGDLPALKNIIDNHPLTYLKLRTHTGDYGIQVMEMVMESPMNTLRTVRLDGMDIIGSKFSLYVTPSDQLELVERILLRFRRIRYFSLYYNSHDDLRNQCRELCQRIRETNHRRYLHFNRYEDEENDDEDESD